MRGDSNATTDIEAAERDVRKFTERKSRATSLFVDGTIDKAALDH